MHPLIIQGGTVFSIGFAGDGDLYNVDLADQLDGTYHISVTPNKPGITFRSFFLMILFILLSIQILGNYVVFISLGEVDIAASPIGFQVTP